MAKEIKYISGTTLSQNATVYTVPAGKIAKIRLLEFRQVNRTQFYSSYFYSGGSYTHPTNTFMCPARTNINQMSNTLPHNILDSYESYGFSSSTEMNNSAFINSREMVLGANDTLKYYFEDAEYSVNKWSFMIIEEDLGVQ